MKVLAALLFVAAALAAPQGVEEEAEFVPRKTVPGGGDGGDGGDGFVYVIPRGWNPFRNFFRNIFLRRPDVSDTESEGGVVFDAKPEDPNNRGGFFSIIDSLFRLVPTPSENATVTFQNSTVEVVNIAGIDMLVNRTIVEHTDTNGAVYRRVDQRIVGPYNSTSSTIPGADDEANELEFEPSTTHKHILKKRWISWLGKILGKRNTAPGRSHNHLSSEEEERHVNYNLEDDIAVNYLNGPLPINPDAEVFDEDLVREGERRFWERRGNSGVSHFSSTQPDMSESPRSLPHRSQPIRRRLVML